MAGSMAKFVTKKTGVFILLCLITVLPATDAQCNEAVEPTFGQNCSFFCHCMDNEQCDSTTGYCSKGCDFDWVGPACQRRNIILLKGENEDYAVTRHSSNTSPNSRYASLAVDRNLTSCSYTTYANVSTDNPWWRVWLLNRHTIRNIVIVTEKSATEYFKGFTVIIGNVTYANRLTGKFDGSKNCYTYIGPAPDTKTINVTCNNDVIGNQVKIELSNNNTQLVLCDVRIYGECENGTFSETCTERCSQYCEDACDKLTGTCQSCQPGWTGSHCNQECATGLYGYGCQHNCSVNCVNDGRICDSVNGSCLSGCQEGWFGKNCTRDCPPGLYGHNCLQNCSNNCARGSVNCDRVYGSCTFGCKAGFNGRKCDEECANGTWGFGCTYTCGSCRSRTCRPTDGVCYDSCLPGFKHSAHCDEVCVEGTYGLNCSNICSENCRGTCDKVTGRCFYCKSGWNGEMCMTACEEGSWGDNCERRCMTCRDDKCDRFSGTCNGLCKPGFKQTDYCDHECDTGWFGINCTEQCSQHCRNASQCRMSDGVCFGCVLGREGEHCEKAVKETDEAIPHYILVVCIALSCVAIFTIGGVVIRFFKRKRKVERKKCATVSFTNSISADINMSIYSGTETHERDCADNSVYLTAAENNDTMRDTCGGESDGINRTECAYQTIIRESDKTTDICGEEADEFDGKDCVYQTIIETSSSNSSLFSDIRKDVCGAEADEIGHIDNVYQTVIGKLATNICGAEADEIDHMDFVYQTIIRKSDTTTNSCDSEADEIDHMDSAYQIGRGNNDTTLVCVTEADDDDHMDQTIKEKSDVDSACQVVYQKTG